MTRNAGETGSVLQSFTVKMPIRRILLTDVLARSSYLIYVQSSAVSHDRAAEAPVDSRHYPGAVLSRSGFQRILNRPANQPVATKCRQHANRFDQREGGQRAGDGPR